MCKSCGQTIAMATLYRIQYKIIEPTKFLAGVRVVEESIDKYIEFLRKTHPDASVIYLELLEEFEAPASETAKESVIILGLVYDPII